MAGKSPVKASEQQRTALEALAASRERGEADRARAVLLTLNGWTSARIAEAFGVREDTVRLWRSDFMRGGLLSWQIRQPGRILCSRGSFRRRPLASPFAVTQDFVAGMDREFDEHRSLGDAEHLGTDVDDAPAEFEALIQ
jgi:hypothetical protein